MAHPSWVGLGKISEKGHPVCDCRSPCILRAPHREISPHVSPGPSLHPKAELGPVPFCYVPFWFESSACCALCTLSKRCSRSREWLRSGVQRDSFSVSNFFVCLWLFFLRARPSRMVTCRGLPGRPPVGSGLWLRIVGGRQGLFWLRLWVWLWLRLWN